MLAQGVPLRVVMEVLGHSSINLTANTYSHVMPSLVQDATEKVAGVLFGSSDGSLAESRGCHYSCQNPANPTASLLALADKR